MKDLREIFGSTTKKVWTDICNWKCTDIGWAKKAKENLAAFKVNKTKHTKPYATDYESVLPDLSYNSWDIL